MLAVSLALALIAAAPGSATARPIRSSSALKHSVRHFAVVALREEQGHHCQIIQPDAADKLRSEIRAAAGRGALRYVVLIGDVPVENVPANSLVTVPTHYVASQVIHRFGGEKMIAGDNWYADLDDDQLPDVSIGRLPADSPEDLRTMVDKIIAYERRAGPGQLATANQPDCRPRGFRRDCRRRDRSHRQTSAHRGHSRRIRDERYLRQLAQPVLS